MARLKYKLEEYSTREISTKLGTITVDLASAICFPQGIVGFSNLHYYCLAEIPEQKLPGALLLQNLEEEKLGFIVLPLADKFIKGDNPLINYEDIKSAAESYSITQDNLSVLVISTISRLEGKFKITINLKAPILIDKNEKVAYQHVFIKNEYPLDYPLN
jgi:flagellar assembly factor FliW